MAGTWTPTAQVFKLLCTFNIFCNTDQGWVVPNLIQRNHMLKQASQSTALTLPHQTAHFGLFLTSPIEILPQSSDMVLPKVS